MQIFTLLVMAAMVATVASLATGIVSMACDGEVGHQSSAQWMGWRVVFQAAAFLMILLALTEWQ
jgi:hypothetical protein